MGGASTYGDNAMNDILPDSRCTGGPTILRLVCQYERPCKRCKATIHFVRVENKWAPFNHDGESHFKTCPFATEFRKVVEPKPKRKAMQSGELFESINQRYPD